MVYLITDAERTGFLNLKNNEERIKFIEEFWQNRNPSPGSDKNLFRDEHYRRVAFANEFFSSTKPGCLTERGRIYILHGPPDQIELYPKTGQSGHRREIWWYANKEFQFDLSEGDLSTPKITRTSFKVYDLIH